MVTTVKRQHGLDAIKPYVPGKPIEEVQREYGLTDIIKLASNENPLGTSPKVMAAIQAALPQLNYYPEAQGYGLCRAIARHVGLRPDQVRLGNGADGLIREICVSYLEDGDEVVVSRSSFPVYDISASVMRARLVKTPLKDYGIDLDAMAGAITPRTKVVFVCNPNNPTGTMSTAAEVDRFMARVPDHVLVVLDEAYYEFVDAPDYPDSLRYVREGRKNVIVLRTFSKVYGVAGLRLGYGLADKDVLAPMQACMESFPVNRLAQVAGEAALEDDEFRRLSVETNYLGREYLYREFDRMGVFCVKSQGNFVLARVGPEASIVLQELLQRGVIVRSCVGYDLPEFLRITVGTPAQNERLVLTLERVLAYVHSAEPA